MSKVQLIALDLDGTLLDGEKEISQENQKAIEKALDAGIIVIPATGRTSNGLDPYFWENPRIYLAICANGAVVENFKTNEVLHRASLSKEKLVKMERRFAKENVLFDVFREGKIYTDTSSAEKLANFHIDPAVVKYIQDSRTPVPNIAEWIENLPEDDLTEKATIFFKSEAEKNISWDKIRGEEGLLITSSMGPNLEINSDKASKGQGIRWLANHLNIPIEKVMACGDNGNDLDMIEAVGVGVAMGNAVEEVKAAANVITETNINHGVAKAIEKYAL